MSFTAPQDTLRYHAHRPLGCERPVGGTPLTTYATIAKEEFSGHGKPGCMGDNPMAPEEAALIFYGLQHGASVIRDRFGLDSPLPQPALDLINLYHAECAPIAIRLAYYVCWICIGEARHKHWSHDKREKFEKGLAVDMSEEKAQAVAKYFYKVCSTGKDHVLTHPAPGMTLGDFSRGLVRVFMNGGFSTAYGGPKWKVIAQTFDDFVKGKLSAQLFIDRAMNLAHNTAPIFNKGYLFAGQSNSIKYILDVQHSSQIPNLLLAPGKFKKFVTPRVHAVHEAIQKAVGDAFATPVDWFKVAATSKGGVSYHSLKAEQTSAGQTSEHAIATEQAEIKAQIEKQKNTYIVDHKLSLKKLTREQL